MGPTIALDAMGGDHGPSVVVPAAIAVLSKDPALRLILVGDQAILEPALDGAAPGSSSSGLPGRLSIQHAPERVEMTDLPSQALRGKKNSSMRVAVDLVLNGAADACVSAGNTGALMATARFVLKTLPGIDRPAIISALPAASGHTHMLDLGANVEASAEQLFQFAVMGSVVAHAVDNLERPRVGLLNIGEEEIKGNDRVREAARLLGESDLNYVGFVEGDDIYHGGPDVVVCDGFTGNVALKSSEGLARMMGQLITESFTQSWWSRVVGLAALPVLRSVRRRMDPRRYNGASFVGLRGIVVKSHGSADALSFSNAIGVAKAEIRQQVPERIREQLDAVLSRREVM